MTTRLDTVVMVRRLLFKVIRFALVGGASTLLFAALTWFAVEKTELRPTWAACFAYITLIPLNFVAHRYFTFNSRGDVRYESGRFALIHALNLSLTVAAMAAIEGLRLDYRIGIAFSAVFVPFIVFALMNRWVFRHQHPVQDRPMPPRA
jgi:putative flippase GtrA